jgi:hypothetical protein
MYIYKMPYYHFYKCFVIMKLKLQKLSTVLVTVVRTSVVRRGCPSSQIYVLVSVRNPMSDELDLSALVS